MDEQKIEEIQAMPPALRLKVLSREIFRIAAELEKLSKELHSE